MKTIALATSSERPRRSIGTVVTRVALFSGVRVKRVNMPVSIEYEVGVQLMSRSVHGIELTAAGRAFLDHAHLALMQLDAAAEAARRAAQPARKTFAIGFQTGHEMNWLPRAMHVLRDELKNIQITVTSDYSPDLAEAIARGRLDLAFLRVEPGYDLGYHVVDRSRSSS